MMTIAWALCAAPLLVALVLGVIFPKMQPGQTRPLLLSWLAGLILGALHLMDVV
jgi:hypothetical protein